MHALVFLLISFALSAQSPANEALFFRGEQLLQKNDYFNAITEFKRYLFFSEDSLYRFQANLHIAKAYRTGGFYRLASPFFLEARDLAPDDILYAETTIEQAKNEILKNAPLNALKILKLADKRADTDSLRDLIKYWRGIAEMFAGNFSGAAGILDSVALGDTLASLCREADEETVNPQLLKIVSAFLPGSGQIYLGEYSSGLFSLFWSGLWGYYMVSSISENRIFDGIMTGNFLFFRFYNGNLENAELFAENYNIRVKNRILSFYQNNYNGLKPEW